MELRRFSHFHYIHAIKGGLTTKVLNINSRGKPAMVFKKLTDLYGSIDDKAGLEENIPDGCEFKGETQVFYAERKLFNDEPIVSDSDSQRDIDGQKSDIEVDSMTIKQIMEGCKKRKFRQSKSDDSTKEKLRTSCRRELNHSCLMSDEDDFDLNEALSIWKSKLAKRRKLKSKCDESRISTSSSQYSQTIGNSDLITSDQDLLPSSSYLPVPVDIKVETFETNMTKIKNTNYIIDELSLYCDENINSCLSYGPIGPDELAFNPGLTTSEKETGYCVLNSTCHEYLEGDEPHTFQMVWESSTEWMNEDNLEVHKPHYSDFSASESMEGQYTSSRVSNGSMSEAVSLTEEQLSGTYISPGKCITNEITCQNNSEDMSEAIVLTEEHCRDTYISESKPFTHEGVCMNNGEVFTHLHGITNLNSLQVPETSPGSEVCLTEGSYKDKLAIDHEKCIPAEPTSDFSLSADHGESISTKSTSDCHLGPDHGKDISTNSNSGRNLSPDQHLISIAECPAKEGQPQMSGYSNSERNTSPDFHLDGSMDRFNQFEEPKRHPTRLLSTRTTISPSSQERLSKAMKSMRLHDKECKTCGGKPSFNQINCKVGTAEGCDQMKRVSSDIYHEQNTRKSKKRSRHSASTTKVPPASMRSTTIQNCPDSAIAFTQRQMQDIECLALKLTNHLKSMKAIVEDRLHVEGNKASSFKFNTNEVRTAIADATNAEASARKWLTMMSRDCNRFCKIMKTTEHGSNGSPTAIQKLNRKIKFADEAGGKLCEVRLIDNDNDNANAESLVETSPEERETIK